MGQGDASRDRRAVAGPAGRAVLTVPLERPGDRPGVSWTVQGTIECGSKPDGYEPGDRELLTTLAGQASTAIANVRLTAELAHRLDRTGAVEGPDRRRPGCRTATHRAEHP